MTRTRSGISGLGRRPVASRIEGSLVGETEEFDHPLDVFGLVDRGRHPARVGEDVVGPGATPGDQLVADATREWKVGDLIAMEVAELAAAESKLDPAEAMRPDLDPVPGPDCLSDPRC
jgi:hypothetical protein